MAPITETYSLGAPVDVGEIDHELKKLWLESRGAATRASLMNLAVYSEELGSLERNTQLMAKITENHACRAIVIEADCTAEADGVDAWISAHCHVATAGSKQVCSEQISFRLNGGCTTQLPNIVLSHLDSDLPLYLWWQQEFAEPIDPQLWAWVDRVIYDSQAWKDFHAQMRLVDSSGRKIDIEIRQRDGQPIHEVAVTSGDIEFLVTHAKCGDLLEISRAKSGEKRVPQLMPAGKNDPVSLMSAELMRGGPHHVYVNAVNCIRELL